mgnify:CR=1 FL=1
MSKSYRKSSSTTWWIIGAVAVALSLLVIGGSKNSTSGKTNREVALSCTTDMATKFHIHPHLEIVVNGKKQEIPANIGVKLTCMNALHTHDNSGTVHVEAPEKRDFTLSDFFAVWNKTYNKDQILDYKVDDRRVIRQTVNGEELQDYENTALRDGDQIVIFYEGRK